MNGHRTPRRASARPLALPSRQPSPKQFSFYLIVLLAVITGAALLFASGCGSDGGEGVETSSTNASAGTTVSPSTIAAPTTTTAQATEDAFPVTVTDDNQESVTIEAEPMRIVSTAPANTETLFALGLGDRVVGVTSLDDYPPEVADIEKIGDFQPNPEAITALSPDLVVGYSGNEEALAAIKAAGTPVLILNPASVDQIYANISTIGTATGATQQAADLVESIKAQMAEVTDTAKATGEQPRVFYALDNTLWTAGPGSFVDELLALANAANVAADPGADGAAAQAYYQFAPEQLVAADPDVILLPGTIYMSAEEFTGDPRFSGLKAVKEGRVVVIDDVIVTRPGPRIAEGLQILAAAIHPEAF